MKCKYCNSKFSRKRPSKTDKLLLVGDVVMDTDKVRLIYKQLSNTDEQINGLKREITHLNATISYLKAKKERIISSIQEIDADTYLAYLEEEDLTLCEVEEEEQAVLNELDHQEWKEKNGWKK